MELDEDFEFSNGCLPVALFSLFEEMRGDEELCDIIIKAQNHSLAAHRLVLAAAFPYFRAMFRSGMKESAKKEIIMEDVDPAAMKCLIHFAYNGKLRFPKCKVQCLLETSVYLQNNCVTDACFTFLLRRLTPDNVLSVHGIAENVNHVNTLEQTDRFIRENFDDVSGCDAFLDLSLSRLKAFICRDDLNVMSEEVVFEAVINWVKAQEAERQGFLTELLHNIRILYLTPQFLSRILDEKIIKTSPCRDMLNEAKNYMLEKHTVPLNFPIPERYCKEKHHVKCQKIMGSGMYGIVRGSFSNIPCLLDYLLNHSLCYYDFKKQEWVALRDLKEIGGFSYVICLEDKIYFIRTGLVHVFHLKLLESISYTCRYHFPDGGEIVLHKCKAYIFGHGNSVYCFDPEKTTCDNVGSVLLRRNNMSLGSLGDHIYISGGENCNTKTVVSTVERYDPVTGRSTEISPMLVPRSGHGCTALNGKLYVCGGGSPSAEVYDPVTDKWEFIAPMSVTKNRVSLVPYGSQLYAIDITSDRNRSVKDVELYAFEEAVWKSGKPVPFSHIRVVVTNSASTLRF